MAVSMMAAEMGLSVCYGPAIAEGIATGFIKVAVSKWGRILGVTIVGEGSGEMINEWALAIQNRFSLLRIMLQQHSFSTMGFLNKRVAKIWMMQKNAFSTAQGSVQGHLQGS